MEAQPDYGIDAPRVIRSLFVFGVAVIVSGLLLIFLLAESRAPFAYTLLITGAVLVIEAGLMLLYAKHGKFRHRDRMLAQVKWRGDEQVLDVGTGRGLLLIGAAGRLTSGRAFGIDVWNAQDLSGNQIENALRNAELAGVKTKVELRSEDARAMKFPDGAFDVVLSNLCLHNISDGVGRIQAVREIVRVLKPGGIALISDFKNTAEYERVLQAAGLSVARMGPFLLDTFPPLRVLKATKSSGLVDSG